MLIAFFFSKIRLVIASTKQLEGNQIKCSYMLMYLLMYFEMIESCVKTNPVDGHRFHDLHIGKGT